MNPKLLLAAALLLSLAASLPVACDHTVDHPQTIGHLTAEPASPPSQVCVGEECEEQNEQAGHGHGHNNKESDSDEEGMSTQRAWSYNGEKHESKEEIDGDGCVHKKHRWIGQDSRKHESESWIDNSNNMVEV